MKRYSMPFGQTIGYVHAAPDRTARKSGRSFDSETTFQVWPNRASMARSIRMQESGPTLPGDQWRALVALTPGEGY